MSISQSKFSRLTSQYVRRELLRLLGRKYLPLMARHVQCQPAGPTAWAPFKATIDLSFLQTGIETMAALPTARVGVAKYARLVRYHRKEL